MGLRDEALEAMAEGATIETLLRWGLVRPEDPVTIYSHILIEWTQHDEHPQAGVLRADVSVRGGGSSHFGGTIHPDSGICIDNPCKYCGALSWSDLP